MKKKLSVEAIFLATLGALVLSVGIAVAAVLAGSSGPFAFHVDQTVTNADGSSAHLQGDLTVDVSVPETTTTEPPPTTTEPPPTTTEPPPSGDTVTRTNQRWTCDGPVNLGLLKVTVDNSHFVTPAVQIASGCTGTIRRIEIDNANGDGIHVGAFAHDLTVGSGYVRSPAGGCTLCGALHVDGIQFLGGQRITFSNMDVNYQTATNAALYINQGSGGQQRPTDVVFENSTFRRSPDKNRVVRIGDSLRSGIRNSTVYYCGSGPTCDAPTAPAVWFNGLQTDPVNENTTLIAVG